MMMIDDDGGCDGMSVMRSRSLFYMDGYDGTSLMSVDYINFCCSLAESCSKSSTTSAARHRNAVPEFDCPTIASCI